MNRTTVAAHFANILALLEKIAPNLPPEMAGEFENIRHCVMRARSVSITSCVASSVIKPLSLEDLDKLRRPGAASSRLLDRLERCLREYSPSNLDPHRSAELLSRLIEKTPRRLGVDDAAELAAVRFCNLVGLDECTLDAQYLEIITREALGVAGERPLPEAVNDLRERSAQRFLDIVAQPRDTSSASFQKRA